MNPWLNVLKLCRKKSAIQFPPRRAAGPAPNPLGCLCGNLRQEGGSFISRIMVNGNRVVRRSQGGQISGPHPVVHRGLDKPRDGPKPDLTRDEGGYRDLIGRIVDGGRTPARPQRVISEPKRRKTIEIRGFKGQLADFGEIEGG